MNISLQDLPQHLQETLSPLYLVLGDEPVLLEDACQLIRHTAAQKGFSAFFSISSQDTDNLLNLCSSQHQQSLFDEKKYVAIECQTSIAPATAEILLAYVKNPNPEQVVVLWGERPEFRVLQNSFWKTWTKEAVSLTIWPMRAYEYQTWLKKEARQLSLRLSSDAFQWLAQHTEGNALAGKQALKKLALENSPAVIDAAMLQERILPQTHHHLFELTTLFLAGEKKKALTVLEERWQAGEAPALLLWALTRYLPILCTLTWPGHDEATRLRQLKAQVKNARDQTLLHQLAKKQKHSDILAWITQASVCDGYLKTGQTDAMLLTMKQLLVSV